MIVLLLIIVIVIIVIIIIIIIIVVIVVIIKRIVIIKQIIIINGMILGTIIDGDKSSGRQKTEDKWVPLPSTPPPLCVVFLPHVTYRVGGGIC